MEERTSGFGQGETRRCPYCYELVHADALKCRYCRSALDPTREGPRTEGGPSEKMLLGVCARLAARYQVPVTLVRVVFVLLTLFHGFGILLYLILWAMLPGLKEGEEPKASQWVQTVRRFFRAVRRAFHEEARGAREPAGPGDSGVEKPGDVNPAESR